MVDIVKFDELLECDQLYITNSSNYYKILEECHQVLSDMNPNKTLPLLQSIIDQSKFTTKLTKKEQNSMEMDHQDEKVLNDSLNGDHHHMEAIKKSLGYKVSDPLDDEWKAPQKPCIAILGQVKAGKSCLVNCLLNDRVVIQAERRMTARITHITHCPVKFVAEMHANRVVKLDVDQDLKIEDVELDYTQRDNPNKVEIQLKVGRNNPVLSYGFNVIDSPGLNENNILNGIIDEMIKSILPIIVYVIDGRKSLTEEDARDIRDIKHAHPELNIIYFVTKLDRSKYDKRRRPNDDEIEVAKRRLKNTFHKLKQYGFVAQNSEWNNCDDFHGASLWSIMDLLDTNISSNREVIDLDEYNGQLFSRFQTSLIKIIRQIIETPLITAVDDLQLKIQEIIEKLINLGNSGKVLENKIEKLNQLENLEKELFDTQLKEIDSRLYEDLLNMINKNEKLFAERIKNSELSPDINQKFRNSKNPERDAPIHYENMLEQLKKTFEVALNTELKSFMAQFVSNKEESLREKLQLVMYQFLDPTVVASSSMAIIQSFRNVLAERLLFDYDFRLDNQNGAVQRRQYVGVNLKQVYNAMKKIFPPDTATNSFETLKKQEILTLLSDENKSSVANDISLTIRKQFKDKHEHFIIQLKYHSDVLCAKLEDKDTRSVDVCEYSERYSFLYAKCFHIKTSYDLRIDDLPQMKHQPTDKRMNICKDNKSGKLLLKYDYQKITNSSKFGKEVYYASRLEQRNWRAPVVNLLGVRIIETEKDDHPIFCETYCEYVEMDCVTFLNERKLTDKLMKELILGLATSLNTLTEIKIARPNLELKNVWIRESQILQPVFSNYGFLEQDDVIGEDVDPINLETFRHLLESIVDRQRSNISTECVSFIKDFLSNSRQTLKINELIDKFELLPIKE